MHDQIWRTKRVHTLWDKRCYQKYNWRKKGNILCVIFVNKSTLFVTILLNKIHLKHPLFYIMATIRHVAVFMYTYDIHWIKLNITHIHKEIYDSIYCINDIRIICHFHFHVELIRYKHSFIFKWKYINTLLRYHLPIQLRTSNVKLFLHKLWIIVVNVNKYNIINGQLDCSIDLKLWHCIQFHVPMGEGGVL